MDAAPCLSESRSRQSLIHNGSGPISPALTELVGHRITVSKMRLPTRERGAHPATTSGGHTPRTRTYTLPPAYIPHASCATTSFLHVDLLLQNHVMSLLTP